MYQVGDYVVYKWNVCKIVELRDNSMNGIASYSMRPIDDESLKIDIPVQNGEALLRKLMTKEEIEALIQKIPDLPILDVNQKTLETDYRNLMKSGSHEDLITIIKTTYSRNQERMLNRKRPGDKDSFYLEQAENYLYHEIRMVLGISYEEAKQYVIDAVESLRTLET